MQVIQLARDLLAAAANTVGEHAAVSRVNEDHPRAVIATGHPESWPPFQDLREAVVGSSVDEVDDQKSRIDASPPTRRVVEILHTLAGYPIRPWTLSQLVVQTGLSKATAHSILGTLEAAAMVTRDPASKGYLLGPAVIGLGRAAEESIPGGVLTKLAVTELSESTGMPVTTVACRDGGLVVIDVVHPSRSADGLPVRVGQRIPASPPFGIVFATWPPPDPHGSPDDPGANPGNAPFLYGDLVSEVRARGYTVQRVSDTGLHLSLTISELPASTRDSDDELIAKVLSSLDNHDYSEAEMRGRSKLDVGLISAPVLSDSGEALLSVSLWPRRALGRSQVRSLAAQLVAATARSSNRLAAVADDTLGDDQSRGL